MKSPSLSLIAKITIFTIIKAINIPSLFHSPADPTADYELLKPLYTAIPMKLALAIFLIADLLSAYLLNSLDFLYYSMLTPLDSSSIVNLILILFPRNRMFELTVYSSHCHIASFNAFWFSTLMMTKQFAPFYNSLITIYQHFFVLKDPRLIILFINPSTFKNYLLIVYRSRFISIYTILYIVFLYYHMDERVAVRYYSFVSLVVCFLYIVELKYYMKSGAK